MTTSENLTDWIDAKLIIHKDWGFSNDCCSFDSQPSFLYHDNNKLFYLYVRHNPMAGVRKLQLFISNDIYNWSNNSIQVNIEQNLSIYSAYIFLHKDKFYAIGRYYENEIKYINTTETNNCLLVSDDGINFNILIKNFVSFKDYGFIVNNSFHKKNDELYVYFATEEGGILTKHKINID
jgi:hypothetical protein